MIKIFSNILKRKRWISAKKLKKLTVIGNKFNSNDSLVKEIILVMALYRLISVSSMAVMFRTTDLRTRLI
jgi:hypothetical protein